MKKLITKAAAFIAAAAMTVSAVSCSGKESSSEGGNNLIGGEVPDDVSIAAEDMPYGAQYKTLTPDDADIPMGIDFDPRYMTDDEAKKVVDYFYSMSSREPARLENAVYPPVLKYRLANSPTPTAQEFLDSEYELIKNYTQSEYSFTFVLVDGALTDAADSGEFSAYDAILQEADPDANVTDKKLFMVNCTYSKPDDGGVYSLQMRLNSYLYVAVYTIDGEPYVIS